MDRRRAKKLDDLLKAGKTADEIATALQRTPLPFIRGYSSFTENDRSHERPMTQPNGLRGRSAKDWTAADDERLRELWVKGMSAREIGIELNFTAVSVRSRAFRLNLLERKPVVSQIGTWEKKLGLKAKGK
jgi:GcrA cell cycle regulator